MTMKARSVRVTPGVGSLATVMVALIVRQCQVAKRQRVVVSEPGKEKNRNHVWDRVTEVMEARRTAYGDEWQPKEGVRGTAATGGIRIKEWSRQCCQRRKARGNTLGKTAKSAAARS